MSAPTDGGSGTPAEELESSKLGTKEYWDEAYNRELNNFADTGDIGEVWFGEDSIERVLRWMDRCSLISKDASMLDLGCGNGMMLIELCKQGYQQLYGVDYIQEAVELARAIADQESCHITYERGDLLEQPLSTPCLQKEYKLCIDKGTYDAISLCPDDATGKRAAYITNVWKLLSAQGLLIITSCNWTQDEILTHFSDGFILFEKIPTPTFKFGGMTGSRETALVLQKKNIA